MKALKAWAVIGEDGHIIRWRTMSDGEEGFEIHRTRKLALGARFADESIAPVRIWVGKPRNRARRIE